MTLKRTQRTRSAADISEVFRTARPSREGSVVARMLRTGDARTTFAITVPVSVGKAHERNRLRRRVSEALRSVLAHHPAEGGFRVVITAHDAGASTVEMTAALVKLLTKSGILHQ